MKRSIQFVLPLFVMEQIRLRKKRLNATLSPIRLILMSFAVFSLMACDQPVKVSDPDKEKKQMIESYLDQAFKSEPNEVVKRYENKTMKVAMKITVPNGTPEVRAEYHKAFKENIALYERLTGYDLVQVDEGDDLAFIIFIHAGNVADIAGHEWYRETAFLGKKGKELEKALTNLRSQNPMNRQNRQSTLTTREVFFCFGIINSIHPKIDPKDESSTVIGQMNALFFKGFTQVINLKNLPSIASIPRKFKSLQPIDIAYVKSLYSEPLQSGMPYKQAKPLLMHLMQQNLAIQWNKGDATLFIAT